MCIRDRDASLQEIESWVKDDDQYVTDGEIIALVNCNDNEIEDQYQVPTDVYKRQA